MNIKILREDSTEVDLAKLIQKILEKMEAEDSPNQQFCFKSTLELTNQLSKIPMVNALLYLNRDIIRVFSIILQAGYFLGTTIEKNKLKIEVVQEINATTETNRSSSTTNSNSNSA